MRAARLALAQATQQPPSKQTASSPAAARRPPLPATSSSADLASRVDTGERLFLGPSIRPSFTLSTLFSRPQPP